MKEERIIFPAGDLRLEGMIARTASTVERGAVLCHPHPVYGGSMFNNVVEAAPITASIYDLNGGSVP